MIINDLDTRTNRVMLVALPMVSWGLERLLETQQQRWAVAGVVCSIAEGIPNLPIFDPDLILFDLDNHDVSSIEHLQAKTSAKILILTSSNDMVMHDDVILSGASGVVGKYEKPDVLLQALDEVSAGEMWVKRGVTARLFFQLVRDIDPPWRVTHRVAAIGALTLREKNVVKAMLFDPVAPCKVIAFKLNIGEHTLRNHLTSIYRKLAVQNRAGMHAYVKQHGSSFLDR